MASDAEDRRGADASSSDGSAEEFAITSRTDDGGGQLTVLVKGELDLLTAGQLKQTLDDELSQGRAVWLDLSGVSFIDSSGLSVIVAAIRHSEEAGGRLRVAPELQSQMRRLFEVTGLLSLLEGH